MNNFKQINKNQLINDARMAAVDVAGTLDHLAGMYADLAVFRQGSEEEKRLASIFSTIHVQAKMVVRLIDESLG